MSEGKVPIAEIFHSVQGEGQWVGTPMMFVRLAGCNVGRPAKALKVEGPFPLLQNGEEAMACSSWDGRVFPCDTDYSRKFFLTPELILDQAFEQHICITGGEPLLHQDAIRELWSLASNRGIKLHIETSGTIQIQLNVAPSAWITVAPKLMALTNMITRADELKILVDKDFDSTRMTPQMRSHPNVFLCPINGVNEVDKGNVDLCIDLLRDFPHWRLSFQAHKFLQLR